MSSAPAPALVLRKRTSSDGEVHIIGSNHVDPHSITIVCNAIRAHKPDTVVIEHSSYKPRPATDAHGANSMLPPPPCQRVYPSSAVFPGVLPILYFTANTSILRALVGGGEATLGAEMDAAMQEGLEIGASIVLADRDMSRTLARCKRDITLPLFYRKMPGMLACLELPPHYVPPPRLLLGVVWAMTWRDWTGLSCAMRQLMLDASDCDPLYASSPAGRQLATWNTTIVALVAGLGASASASAAAPSHTNASDSRGTDALGSGRVAPTLGPGSSHRAAVLASLVRLSDATHMLPEFLNEMPTAITSERDLLLASAIKHAPGQRVVAVVGKGHLAGIDAHWDSVGPPESLQYLIEVPSRGAVIDVALPVCGIAAIGYGTFRLRRALGARSFNRYALTPVLVTAGATCIAVGGLLQGHAALRSRLGALLA